MFFDVVILAVLKNQCRIFCWRFW